MRGSASVGSSHARLAAVGLTATTILLLAAGLSMLQPLATDLYLSTLPGIAVYFSASVASVQSTLWMFIAAFGIWQLVAGPLSDRIGRYPVVVAGAFTYCAASVLAMLAQSLEVLIVGRILLLGFVMMLIAVLVGIWIGASYNATVYPLTLTIGAGGLASAAIAFTLVRRDGDIAAHG